MLSFLVLCAYTRTVLLIPMTLISVVVSSTAMMIIVAPMLWLRGVGLRLFGIDDRLLLQVQGEFLLFERVVSIFTTVVTSVVLARTFLDDITIFLFLVVCLLVLELLGGTIVLRYCCLVSLQLCLELEQVIIVVEHEIECFHFVLLLFDKD